MTNLLELVLWAQVNRPFPGPAGGPGFRPSPSGPSSGDVTSLLMIYLCVFFFILLISIPAMAGMWKTFAKAGEPGWAAIIPIYNLMIMSKIAGKGEMHGLIIFLVGLIPCVGPIIQLVMTIMLLLEFCNQYDVGGGFVAGLIFLPFIFWPIMGFGSTRYMGNRRRRAFDDEDDRPRRRRTRSADEDDDDSPRKRRDDDDRIRKPRRDDDDDDEPRVRKPRRDDDY